MNLPSSSNVGAWAFPAISTGVFGYPLRLAAQTAISEVMTFLDALPADVPVELLGLVRFVLFGEQAMAEYSDVLAELANRS